AVAYPLILDLADKAEVVKLAPTCFFIVKIAINLELRVVNIEVAAFYLVGYTYRFKEGGQLVRRQFKKGCSKRYRPAVFQNDGGYLIWMVLVKLGRQVSASRETGYYSPFNTEYVQ